MKAVLEAVVGVLLAMALGLAWPPKGSSEPGVVR
jgi:hypothetical protein